MMASSATAFGKLSWITVKGVRSLVRTAGPPDAGEAVVFIHGLPGSLRDWDGLQRDVGQWARTIAFDLPGYGQADKPATFGYTVRDFADHIDGLLTRLRVRRAHLVMHDLGGVWGLEWAIRQPERVDSVILIDTGYVPGYRWNLFAQVQRTPLVGELFQRLATRPLFAWIVQHAPRRIPQEFINVMWQHYDSGTRRAVMASYRSIPDLGRLTERYATVLRPLRLPALVLWGQHDVFLPAAYATKQPLMLPLARVVVLEGSGHWPFADNAARVTEEVRSFLQATAHAAGTVHHERMYP
jgi:pimeloyl-ACP methyl ester carboxylesterase